MIATSCHPVGIDIETFANCRLINSDLEKVLLSQSQLELLDKVGYGGQTRPDDRKREVLRLWVHKEAYLKAIGTGLSISPKEIELLERASGSFQIVTPKEHSATPRKQSVAPKRLSGESNEHSFPPKELVSSEAMAWFSRELQLQPSSEFVGAVVSRGLGWSVNYFDFVVVLGNARAEC